MHQVTIKNFFFKMGCNISEDLGRATGDEELFFVLRSG